jgi:hypothetical protein
MADLQAATDHIPKSEHAPEAKRLFEAMQPSTRRQRCGPRRLGEILPVVLAKLGVNAVDLSLKGRTTSSDRTGRGAEQRLVAPISRSLCLKLGDLSDHQRLIRRRGVTPLMY